MFVDDDACLLYIMPPDRRCAATPTGGRARRAAHSASRDGRARANAAAAPRLITVVLVPPVFQDIYYIRATALYYAARTGY